MSNETDSLKIALLQHSPAPNNIPAALQRLNENTALASADGCALLLVPEASITGYNIPKATMQQVALEANGKTTRAIADICRQHNIAIAYGFAEKDGSAYFNCAQ